MIGNEHNNVYEFPKIKRAEEVDNTLAEPEQQVLVLESTIALAAHIHNVGTKKLTLILESFVRCLKALQTKLF